MVKRMSGSLLCTLGFAAGAGLAASGAMAQAYPARPVQVVVSFPAGGSVDIMARHLVNGISGLLGQSFVVVNRDGASGTIGFGSVASAKPDGYTLAAGPTTPITNAPHLMKGVPYGLDSFEYVCQAFENWFLIAVRADSPLRSINDLIAEAKAHPGKLTYGHSGVGTVPHLATADFAQRAGIELTHTPYRGEAPMLPDLIGGRLSFGATSLLAMVGRNLRVLAMYSDRRHPAFPDAPALTEFGVPPLPPGLNGLYAPKGTPPEVVRTLETACETVTRSEAYRAAAQKLHQPVVFLTGAAFAKRAAEDYRIKADLVKVLKLGPE